MILNSVLNQKLNEEEVVDTTNLFAIDYLKIKVQITNNPEKLSKNMVIPLAKFDDEFQALQHSYSKQWVCGSYNDKIQIKSLNENELLIQLMNNIVLKIDKMSRLSHFANTNININI